MSTTTLCAHLQFFLLVLVATGRWGTHGNTQTPTLAKAGTFLVEAARLPETQPGDGIGSPCLGQSYVRASRANGTEQETTSKQKEVLEETSHGGVDRPPACFPRGVLHLLHEDPHGAYQP